MRSPEIEAVIRRYLDAVEVADTSTIEAIVDRSEHTVILGSDPSDRVVGADAVEFLATSAALRRRDYTYNIIHLDAFQHESVGWAAVDGLAEFALDPVSGKPLLDPIPVRITAVLVLQRGIWQMVQWHFSTPQPDDVEVTGIELSRAMREMMVALEEGAQASELAAQLQTNTVSLVFTDIVDSTKRTGEAGDEAWTATITTHFGEIERIAAQNEGVVVKTTGDGAMLAFNSARKAVLAALELRRSAGEIDPDYPLRLRIGVHIGEAVKAEADYFGQTVNETARIMAAAQPDQILVSDLVRNMVGEIRGVDFGAPMRLEFKGIPGTRQVHPAVAAST